MFFYSVCTIVLKYNIIVINVLNHINRIFSFCLRQFHRFGGLQKLRKSAYVLVKIQNILKSRQTLKSLPNPENSGMDESIF